MTNVLFICVHNSARSQMAEAYCNLLGAGEFTAESAGLEPTEIMPEVVRVMAEEGVDLRKKGTQSVFDLFREGRRFDYIITVCDAEAQSKCPIFPGIARRMLLPFPDPAGARGTDEEIMAQVREIRDAIRERTQLFIDCVKSGKIQKTGADWDMACQD